MVSLWRTLYAGFSGFYYLLPPVVCVDSSGQLEPVRLRCDGRKRLTKADKKATLTRYLVKIPAKANSF